MDDKIMAFVGICMGLLMLTFAGALLTMTITQTQPKKQIEMEIK